MGDISDIAEFRRKDNRNATIDNAYYDDNRKTPGTHFQLTRFGSIKRNNDPSYDVKDMIPSGGLVLVWGPPKCGKSFWVFDIVMHAALELPYRNHKTRGALVVYLALEGGRAFANRVEAWRQYHQVADADFYLITDRIDLVFQYGLLIDDIRKQTIRPPSVVVIDTLNRSLNGSENKDEDMGAYIKAADIIRAAFACTVIIVHHCGVEANRPRGHTSLIGAVDAQIAVKRDDFGNVIATVEWLKDGEEGTVIVSRLETVELGWDSDGERLSSCVVIPAETDGKNPVVAAKVPKQLRTFLRILDSELVANGNRQRPFLDGQEVIAVSLETLRQEFDRQSADEKSSTRRMAWKRAVNDAQSKGLVGIRDGWIWRASHSVT